MFKNALNDDKVWAEITARILSWISEWVPEVIDDVRDFMIEILVGEQKDESIDDQATDWNQGLDEPRRWEDGSSPQESRDIGNEISSNR